MDTHDNDWQATLRQPGARRPEPWRRLLAGALVTLGLQLPAAGYAGCQVKILELPVHMVGTRAIATVGINGQTVPLVVDSGAFFSFLTDAAAAQLQLPVRQAPLGMRVEGLTGRVDVHLTRVDHLELLKGNLPNVDFIVGGNEPGAGAMGMLGRNLLSFTDTEYDLAHGLIRFVYPSEECAGTNMAYWAEDQVVSELALARDYGTRMPAIRATARLNDSKIDVLFDTGASTTVSLRAAKRAGVKQEDMTSAHEMYGAGRGGAQAWTAAFAKFELAGEAIFHNRLAVADFDIDDGDMLLGIDFFLSHRIYVSKERSRMFFTYNGGAVFALNVSDASSGAASGVDTGKAGDAMDADAYARRGAASRARGDFAAALADLDHAIALDARTASFFTARATVQLAMKQPDKALSDLDTALALDPAQAEARLQRAWMQEGTGHGDAALADLDVLDRTLASQSQMRASMANLYMKLGLPARAIAQWDAWIAAHPRDIALGHAYNGRCWVRMTVGLELDKALDDCDEAVDRDSKNASFLDSRAWVYLRLGKWAKAMTDFDRALAISPGGAWSLYGRGFVRLRLGETTAGLADLAAARKLQPGIDAEAGRIGLPVVAAAAP